MRPLRCHAAQGVAPAGVGEAGEKNTTCPLKRTVAVSSAESVAERRRRLTGVLGSPMLCAHQLAEGSRCPD